MKMRDNGIYHNMRLSPNNPDHMKINAVLLDVNRKLYKSKNQFMTEAMLNYIAELEGTPLTNRAQKEFNNADIYITKKEMANLIMELKRELTQYVDKEVLSVIIKVFSENIRGEKENSVAKDISNNSKDENPFDERLIELARSWS